MYQSDPTLALMPANDPNWKDPFPTYLPIHEGIFRSCYLYPYHAEATGTPQMNFLDVPIAFYGSNTKCENDDNKYHMILSVMDLSSWTELVATTLLDPIPRMIQWQNVHDDDSDILYLTGPIHEMPLRFVSVTLEILVMVAVW